MRDENIDKYNSTQILRDRLHGRAIVRQYPIENSGEDVPELAIISQPPGVALDRIFTYAAQEEVPLRSRIYIVDTGGSFSPLPHSKPLRFMNVGGREKLSRELHQVETPEAASQLLCC